MSEVFFEFKLQLNRSEYDKLIRISTERKMEPMEVLYGFLEAGFKHVCREMGLPPPEYKSETS